MKRQTVDVFHALMKKGWIDRSENSEIWRYCEDPEVIQEIETMGEGLGFDAVFCANRIYLVPTQNNDLFLKNNADFRKDIGGDEIKNKDIYLMNYISIYLIYLFYCGEGNDPKCRDFITKEDFIEDFSEHCRACIKGADSAQKKTDYSDNFIQLANTWLSKTDGPADSRKNVDRYGVLNRLLVKFNADHDDLFYVEGGKIMPSRKLDDLMPYFLRKDRVSAMQEWIKGIDDDGADIENQDSEF